MNTFVVSQLDQRFLSALGIKAEYQASESHLAPSLACLGKVGGK